MQAERFAIALIAFAFASCQQAVRAHDEGHTTCNNVFGRPLVADQSTAFAIAAAVIAEHEKINPPERAYELSVEEEGDHWVASQDIQPVERADGNVPITFGGGGLGMQIAKCDGALSSVFLQR